MNYDREYSLDMLQSLLGRALHELEIGFPIEDRFADSIYSRLEGILIEVHDAMIEINTEGVAREALKNKTELERLVEGWARDSRWEASALF